MPIVVQRQKKIPAATAKQLGLGEISSTNLLEVRAAKDGVHEIILMGAVGGSWWDEGGITEKEFRDALGQIPAGSKINLRINSEGGSVQEGLGIYNAIAERKSEITAYISGYAVSIASVFPLAASRIVSPKSSLWMIHNSRMGAYGTADDMEKNGEMLRKHDDTMAGIYAARTGKTEKEIKAKMDAETWFSGTEAVDWGLADECGEEDAAMAIAACGIPKEYFEQFKNGARAALTVKQISPAEPQGANKNQANIMNKEQIIAMLKKYGIEAADSETIEALQAKLDGALAKAKQPVAVASAADTNPTAEELRKAVAEFKASNITRIHARIEEAAKNKIPLAHLPKWKARAEADEAGVLAELAEYPFAGGGHDGVAYVTDGLETDRIAVKGLSGRVPDSVVAIYKAHQKPEARLAEFTENYTQIMADATRRDNGRVFASNSFSSNVTTNFLIANAITKLVPKLGMAKVVARDNTVDPFKPRASGIQKFNSTTTDGSTVLTNATDFEQTTNTVDGIQIDVNQLTMPFGISNTELNQGFRMADLAYQNMMNLGQKIVQTITTPITTANFATAVTSAQAAFSWSDMATLRAALKNANVKNLAIDGAYLAQITNTPGFFQQVPTEQGGGYKTFGWDYIAENNQWSGAGSNIVGFACDPQAIGMIAGLPLVMPNDIPGGILSVATTMLPGVDLPIAAYMWFSTKTRTYWCSFDIMLGAAKVDATAGFLVKSQ